VTCNVTDGSSREVLISWLPPEDLGTVGSVSVYFVEWGNLLYLGKVPLPQLEQEGLLNVSGVSGTLSLIQIYMVTISYNNKDLHLIC
jgi:hypothetical protein